ncbi:MAG: M14 family metallopeptidase [Bacillati bacterium]
MDPYQELEGRWKALRGRADLQVREVACVGVARTLLCVELGPIDAPAVALSAGIHGDEPAGIWTLLDLVEQGELDTRFSYRLWPCTNPTGLVSGTRASAEGVDLNRTFGRGGTSPEARAILTANRDRKFLASLDLHEDRDAAGFYAYEYGTGTLAKAIIEALDRCALPVQALEREYDLGVPLPAEAMQLERGCVRVDPVREGEALSGFSYSLAMLRRGVPHVLTLEAAGLASPEQRRRMLREAVLTVLARLHLDDLSPVTD